MPDEPLIPQEQGDNTKFFEKALKQAGGDDSKIGFIYFLHAFSASFWIDLTIVLGIMVITYVFFKGDFKLDNASAMAGYTAFLTGAFSIVGRGGDYKKSSSSGGNTINNNGQKQEGSTNQ